MLKPKLLSIIKHRKNEFRGGQLGKDIIAGIIVAIIALPLSIALAIASGVTPEKGLITAIIAGFFVSLLGGSRVQIGGPTGAFVIIIYGIIQKFGMSGLTLATIMAGILMIIFGLMKFGSVIKFIPYPITTGFTSGIAIVLFSTQIKDFFGLKMAEVPSEFIDKWQAYFSVFNTTHLYTLGVGLLTLIIIVLWPKINKKIPGSLIALVVSTLLVSLLELPVETIGSRFGNIPNTFSLIDFRSIDFSLESIRQLAAPAFTIAFLASIESLLSAVVADGMIGSKHRSNMELVAQGVANIASSLFGGIPATGAIARTAANVKNGGRTPVAGIVHSLTILLIMLIFMPLAKLIPMTAMAAILIVISYNMSEWRSFKGLLKSTKSDMAILLVTFFMTVLFDLVFAIGIGMIVAMFFFMRRMSESTTFVSMESISSAIIADDDADKNDYVSPQELLDNEIMESGIMVYQIEGPLFFGVANTFMDIMNEIRSDCRILILSFENVPNIDASAINALNRIIKRSKERKIKVIFAGLNEQLLKVVENTGVLAKVGEGNVCSNVNAAITLAKNSLSLKSVSDRK
ncbi:MAG: STAS domain-containing protein [Clostridiaceae bacterium]|nr:STAS domain-containing protein [Clostridiaceae bacterium]